MWGETPLSFCDSGKGGVMTISDENRDSRHNGSQEDNEPNPELGHSGLAAHEHSSADGDGAGAYSDAETNGDAENYDGADARGESEVYDSAEAYDDAEAYGDAEMYDDAEAYDEEYDEEYDEDEDDDDYDDRPEPKKHAALKLVLLVLLIAVGMAGGVWDGRFLRTQRGNWQDDLAPVGPPDSPEVVFTVERGWTLSRTAQILYESQLIRSAESFVRLGRQEGKAESLKAGRFRLSASMSSLEILEELVKGSILTTRFTIPEGYTLKQIAKVFADRGIADEEEFWRCVEEGDFPFDFLQGLPGDAHRLEGYLFPDTYDIEVDEPVEMVITRMLRRFEDVWDSLPEGTTDLTDREILILASIVQNEMMLDEERPISAGVFYNRLQTNMLLQSCSTVQYYFDEPKFPLLTADTQIDFPYNTYIYPGLPPGPVSSPGRASLEAAMAPGDTPYVYFVAREDGSNGHYFSRTLSEHNAAIAQARANRSGN